MNKTISFALFAVSLVVFTAFTIEAEANKDSPTALAHHCYAGVQRYGKSGLGSVSLGEDGGTLIVAGDGNMRNRFIIYRMFNDGVRVQSAKFDRAALDKEYDKQSGNVYRIEYRHRDTVPFSKASLKFTGSASAYKEFDSIFVSDELQHSGFRSLVPLKAENDLSSDTERVLIDRTKLLIAGGPYTGGAAERVRTNPKNVQKAELLQTLRACERVPGLSEVSLNAIAEIEGRAPHAPMGSKTGVPARQGPTRSAPVAR